jgi:hypothetical protein
MAHNIISQTISPILNGNVVSTTVELTSASDTIPVPIQSIAANGTATAVQVRIPGDVSATVTKTSGAGKEVTIAGAVGGKVLVVTHSAKPISNPV